jgi:hypothetical protein
MTGSVNDFDFIFGEWTITHKRLAKRMAGSDEWLTFETNYEAWPILGGAANEDKAFGEVGGEFFEGRSLRTYDAAKNEWTIYWMDTSNPQLIEQVRGRFANGVGLFYGEEVYEGKSYRMRFEWKKISDDELHWDQAFQDAHTKEWEVNWIMEFHRKAN